MRTRVSPVTVPGKWWLSGHTTFLSYSTDDIQLKEGVYLKGHEDAHREIY